MKKVAIFPGSFDPFTLGHYDLVLRGLELFDKIIILVANNSSKNYFIDKDNRFQLIAKLFKNEKRVEVTIWNFLVANYAKTNKIKYLIRGIRGFDLAYELDYATNSWNYFNLEVVLFPSRLIYQGLSSSLVREVFKANGDISKMVPDIIKRYLCQKK